MKRFRTWTYRWLSTTLAVLSLLLISSPAYSQDLFDSHFQYSTERFLTAYYDDDWYLLKAQGIQESLLDPLAVSHAGAVGVMQFMRPAWGECGAALGIRAHRTNARASIICGGWYQARMLRQWTYERPMWDRWRWGWSSYNCGLRCALRAQRAAYGATCWSTVRPHFPAETQVYVHRIELIHRRLTRP